MGAAYYVSGQPLTMTLNGVTYYYVLNIQGDVMGMVDGNGRLQMAVNYNGYGTGFYYAGVSGIPSTLSGANPLGYRGYVQDYGTGLYYLQSRYYDPEMGRFINADGLVSTGQGLLGNNMFTYCSNNPIAFIDCSGTVPMPCNVSVANKNQTRDDPCILDIGIIVSNQYEWITLETLFIGFEEGDTSSYVVRGDSTKPVFFYIEEASQAWFIWEYRVGVQININDGGVFLSLGLFDKSIGFSAKGFTFERMRGLEKDGFTATIEHNFSEFSGGHYWHGYSRPGSFAVALVLAYATYITAGAIEPYIAEFLQLFQTAPH